MTKLTKGIVLAATMVGLSATAYAAKYKEVDVANGGAISGMLAAGSATAETKSYTISKDPQICGEGTRDVPFVRVSGDAILDAVVYLDKVDEGKAFPDDLKSLKINQEKCTFMPYLSVMANEGELTAVNSDDTLHNIHTYELIKKARRTVINVSQPKKGDVLTKKIKMRKGVGMKVECDAHDFMHAFVFVAKNPYYAVVGDDGTFKIGDIPPGKYEVHVWHGLLGIVEGGEVEVTAGGDTKIDLSF